MRNGGFHSVSRTVPGYAGVRGSATNNATVTINGNAAWRLGEYFYGGDDVDNAASAVMKELDIMAVVNPSGTNEADLVESVTGKVFVAKSPEVFTYDDDGNMLSDGRFIYTWDGENRLVSVETSAAGVSAGAARVRVEYTYDNRSRRIGKVVSHFENDTWTVAESRAFVYDRWNMVQETIRNQQSAISNSLVWGLDLSGSLQGAGGVGGLLAVISPLPLGEGQGEGSTVYLPCYDANGNTMEYVSTDGTLVAHYEYSPFGETVIQVGSLADAFCFRFSTKNWEEEGKLYYYGYRFYVPESGRWLSRDPIGEYFQRHLYSFVKNNGVRHFDLLGLLAIYIGGAGEEEWQKQLDTFRKQAGCDEAFNNKEHAEIEKRIRDAVKGNPCEPIIIVGHSYGGDTAMDVAASLKDLECLCLYVITLDPVSHFDPDTWFWQNPATTNITEWINVYQPAGVIDHIVAIPVVGWLFGGIWAGAGINWNNNMISTGGGQWNNISGPDYRINADNIDHNDITGMMNLKFKDSSGRDISVRDYMNELKGINCCEK